AALERLVELLQPQVGVAETAVCGLKRRERLQEECFRCLENSLSLFHRASRQQALEQSSLMDLSNVQETKLAGDGNAAEFVGLLQQDFLLRIQVILQCRSVLLRQASDATVHGSPHDNARRGPTHRRFP